jgi:hypothetical protein
MEVAFRCYNNTNGIVVVVFRSEGGKAVLQRSFSLDSLSLKNTESTPAPQHELPYGEYKIKNRKSLVRGGIQMKVLFDKKIIKLTALSRNGVQ